MKNPKILLAILVLLVGSVTLSSCKNTKVTEKDGIKYTYIKDSM